MSTDNLIILAAGKPHLGERPALLTQVNGQTLFDWQINALPKYTHTQVVIGYNASEFKSLENRALFHVNNKWEESGSGYSLFSADLSKETILVTYADILYRPSLLTQINESTADITIAYDTHWKQRFIGRTEQDLQKTEKVIVENNTILRAGQSLPVSWSQGEFIGLVRFQGKALKRLQELQLGNNEQLKELSLSGLVEWLRLQGMTTHAVDVQGDWAELNEPKDIAHFILGTKAETLDRLSSMVRCSKVLDQVSFTVSDWENKPNEIIEQVRGKFASQLLVVRSSAKSEDAFTHSNAGAYTSILNVNPKTGLKEAIIEVINSYADCIGDDQVLIQPMLKNVRLSGVAFTRTLEHGAPFYIINYDESGDTESITSGLSKQHKSLYLRKDADPKCIPAEHLLPLVDAIKEVENILNYDALDIEFALDYLGSVYLLQVRPIAAADNLDVELINNKVLDVHSRSSDYWQALQEPSPQIKGNKGLFGVMPDWNPAEIIGTNPGQLAVSLYKELILNDIWAEQRAQYGYKDVRPQPLLRIFAGKPYIDIRASFNSFIPSELPEDLTEKLVSFYLCWLENNPHLHDKIEFDVVPTCVGPTFNKWEQRLGKSSEIAADDIAKLRGGLLTITQNALFRTNTDIKVLETLEFKHQQVVNNWNLSNNEKIRLLLAHCKEYGTLPFAHLARSGFIAVTFLKEGVEAGWLSSEARDDFMESVKTVSQELSEAAWNTAEGNKKWDCFVSEYGHLRPGTYEVTSPAYRDDPEVFLKPLIKNALKPKVKSKLESKWTSEKSGFFNKLRTIDLKATDEEFEHFLITAIEGREKAKFIFTKTLSAVLSLIRQEGHKYSLSAEELSNLPLAEILSVFGSNLSTETLTTRLKRSSEENADERKVSHACLLPPLLCSPIDFSAFILTEEKPNYIGSNRVTAPVIHINGTSQQDLKVEGCIVLIPQADPGYDWLFGQNIAGLITMYGGANSHMAIRSAEFGLPAAIGIGEQLYKTYSRASTIELDPAGETIRLIH